MLQINEKDWIRAILDLRDCSINVTLLFQVLNSGGHIVLNLLLLWFGSSCKWRYAPMSARHFSLWACGPWGDEIQWAAQWCFIIERICPPPSRGREVVQVLFQALDICCLGRTHLLFNVKTNQVFLHSSSFQLRLKSWTTFKLWYNPVVQPSETQRETKFQAGLLKTCLFKATLNSFNMKKSMFLRCPATVVHATGGNVRISNKLRHEVVTKSQCSPYLDGALILDHQKWAGQPPTLGGHFQWLNGQ